MEATAWSNNSMAEEWEDGGGWAVDDLDDPTSRHELVRAWVKSQFQGRVAHSRARPAKQKVAPATAVMGR